MLLYFHHDVQPPLDDAAWTSPVCELTERDGRWYGRGAADCKGNIAMHLTALRALGGDLPVSVKIIGEGSEEQGTGGLEDFVPQNADLLRADAILVCDAGNFAVGVPSLTTTLRGLANVVVTVEALPSPMHSGMFGGAAPDALAALIPMLATLHDERGNATSAGSTRPDMAGVDYPAEQFRTDAGVLDGVELLGDGTVADMLWARPALTVLGIDCPPVVGSSAVDPAERAGTAQPAGPAGDGRARRPRTRSWLIWNPLRRGMSRSSRARVDRATFHRLDWRPGLRGDERGDADAYGREPTTMGRADPSRCAPSSPRPSPTRRSCCWASRSRMLIHAPNESVDPGEIETMALAEALFLQKYATTVLVGK